MKKAQQIRCLYLVLLSLVFLPAIHASGQETDLTRHVMTVWTSREGLPSDTILDVAQDSFGYIWLASYDGLVRFDGETFTVMTPDEGGFTGKSARVIKVAPDGTLWVGTNTAGLYAQKEGHFLHYGIEEGLPDLSVRSIAFGNDGSVWVGTTNGVSVFRGGRFVPAPGSENTVFGIANFILPLNDGTVVVGANLPGLHLITSKETVSYMEDQGLNKWSFSAAWLDPGGQLWLGTNSGQIIIVSRNEVRRLIEPEFLRGSSINAFYGESGGAVWVASDRGILTIKGNTVESFSESEGLPGNVVSSLCRDREGNLWVGTERGGLAKFSLGKFMNISQVDGLISDAVNGVTEDRFRSIWVATDQGVSFFPSTTDSFHTDPLRQEQVKKVLSMLTGVRVRQVRMDSDFTLVFSTYSDHGLLFFHPDGSLTSLTKKDGLPVNRVRFSTRTRKGDLWIGTTAGPVLYTDSEVQAYGIDSGLPNLFILCAMEDSKGRMWLGTDGGGLSILENGKFKTLSTSDGLAGNVVFRILEDSRGNVWACTSDGLSLYTENKFITCNAIPGIVAESVFEIIEDQRSMLWIVTGKKVFLVSVDELSEATLKKTLLAGARSFDRLDGLAGQLSANAWAYINEFGITYFPTLKGLSIYNPQSVAHNTLPPPVRIEKVLVDGASVIPGNGRLILSAHVRRITFHYTALSFVIPQRVCFEYMLEGYDRDWISAGVTREIGYTNLPPGEYSFRVKAKNNDGVVNEAGAELHLKKKPFFYQTILFYIVLASLLVGLGFLIALLRVRQLDRHARELNRLVEERTAELALEQKRSDKLLHNILPPAVALELKNTGSATPQTYGETAVLFADIVGFTPWAETRNPAEVICELNEIFTAFDEIMEKWDCERIKTLGDGYLAC
ncbi:MAG TPA: two-component regulator propeller domain-containing protein, partial [Treponemataceae bacterium]|nr:two-component regulator propeller domain-containing protein [Treponemataceae bacterium]